LAYEKYFSFYVFKLARSSRRQLFGYSRSAYKRCAVSQAPRQNGKRAICRALLTTYAAKQLLNLSRKTRLASSKAAATALRFLRLKKFLSWSGAQSLASKASRAKFTFAPNLRYFGAFYSYKRA